MKTPFQYARQLPFVLVTTSIGLSHTTMASDSAGDWFGIHVVDDASGRGVPLVELETVNHLRFITDSAGWIAIQEPGWKGSKVYFKVKSHGYQFAKDGFGLAGFAVDPVPGQRHTVKVKRLNLAERLYRITGEGLYRDSILLGEKSPVTQPILNGLVLGQDSAQVAKYHDQLYWFMGDTLRLSYPLGQFHTSGARCPLPGQKGCLPNLGIDLQYWTGRDGFSRPMVPLDGKENPYLVWIDGVTAVPDAKGQERLVTHYAKMKTLGVRLEHGMAVWNDKAEIFEPVTKLPAGESWRFVLGHPFRATIENRDYIVSGDNLPNTRVPARYEDLINPASYEAFTCLDAHSDATSPAPTYSSGHAPAYAWRRDARPVTDADEARWLKSGAIAPVDVRFSPTDVDSGKHIRLHYGNTRWNAYRNRWIALFVESEGTSALGEVWYSESESLTGPWLKAKKVITHDRYSFYNPFFHDASFDEKDGRIVYLEGTYASTFSGAPLETSRYDYNQIMYRLDLDRVDLGARN